jgi:hypothetical protein
MPLIEFSTRSLSSTGSDVFRAHALEHVAEQGEQPVGVGAVRCPGPEAGEAETVAEMAADQAGGGTDDDAGHEGGAEQQPERRRLER